MLTIRKTHERGYAHHGWLESHHTFSFAGYHDPEHMGFRDLRVINEDRVQPGEGFGTHFHRDMEIVTWVISGSLEHRDSLGNGSVIRPGDMQRMSAGTGITHSEYNPSNSELLHFLQIWILPERRGIPPSYEQRDYPRETRAGRFCPVASRDGREGSVRIHQDAVVYAASLAPAQVVDHAFGPSRHAWIQIVCGAVAIQGVQLSAGDGAAISRQPRIEVVANEPSEVLVFDLA